MPEKIVKTHEHRPGRRIASLWQSFTLWAEALDRTPTDDLRDRVVQLEARMDRIEEFARGNAQPNPDPTAALKRLDPVSH
jgi:hypothetical protein